MAVRAAQNFVLYKDSDNMYWMQQEPKSVMQRISAYAQSGSGYFRIPKTISLALQWLAECVPNTRVAAAIEPRAQIVGNWANGLAFVRTIDLSCNYAGKITALTSDPSADNAMSALGATADLVASAAYTTSAFCFAKQCLEIGNICSLASDTVDLIGSSTKLSTAMHRRARANCEESFRQMTHEEAVLRVLQVAKAVTAVVGGIFSVLVMILGRHVVSPFVAVTTSLITSILALTAQAQEDSLSWKYIGPLPATLVLA